MQLRETKILTLPDGKTLVEMTYSSLPDTTQAQSLLHLRFPVEAGVHLSLAAIQRGALEAAAEFAREAAHKVIEARQRG
jgi:hypothetical protein